MNRCRLYSSLHLDVAILGCRSGGRAHRSRLRVLGRHRGSRVRRLHLVASFLELDRLLEVLALELVVPTCSSRLVLVRLGLALLAPLGEQLLVDPCAEPLGPPLRDCLGRLGGWVLVVLGSGGGGGGGGGGRRSQSAQVVPASTREEGESATKPRWVSEREREKVDDALAALDPEEPVRALLGLQPGRQVELLRVLGGAQDAVPAGRARSESARAR